MRQIKRAPLRQHVAAAGDAAQFQRHGILLSALHAAGADAMHGVISEDSPFGKALMNRKEGETVIVNAPAGEIEYRIDKIERS